MTTQRKLGCNRSRPDCRTLWWSDYSKHLQPVIPVSADWTPKVTVPWGAMNNDTIGDCAIAAAGHQIVGWTFNSGRGCVPTDPEIVQAYRDVSGYNPGDPLSDTGCAPLDVMRYWRGTGIGGHKCGAYVALNPSRMNQLRQGVALFGSVYLAFSLPAAVQGWDEWTLEAGQELTKDWTPGSWGGHAVESPKFDATGLYVVTWGKLLWVSWSFVEAYCDEAYCVLSSDLLDGTGRCPAGFDLPTLTTDLNAITSVAML